MSSKIEPVFKCEGNRWLIENQKDTRDLVIDGGLNNCIYLYNNANTTVKVHNKVNSITLDSCKHTSIIFDSLISTIEFINCKSVAMKVNGKVSTISVYNTDGCSIFLSADSLDADIITSKSSEVNVSLPKDDGDYNEYRVAEQFKTKVVPGRGLVTVIMDQI